MKYSWNIPEIIMKHSEKLLKHSWSTHETFVEHSQNIPEVLTKHSKKSLKHEIPHFWSTRWIPEIFMKHSWSIHKTFEFKFQLRLIKFPLEFKISFELEPVNFWAWPWSPFSWSFFSLAWNKIPPSLNKTLTQNFARFTGITILIKLFP